MRRLLYLLVIASSVFFASSCTGDKRAEPTPSSSVTPTVTEPTYPPEAEGTDVEAAANFVAYYIDLLDYAEQTGDTEALRTYSSADCEGCYAYIDLYEETYAAGGYFEGSERNWDELRPSGNPDGDPDFLFILTITRTDGTYRLSDDEEAQVGSGSQAEVGLHVSRSTGQWTVLEYGMADES